MKQVKVYERVLYDHYVVIEREGKILRIERRCTYEKACELLDETLDWCEGLNARMRKPFFNVWLCRERGNHYEYTGHMWGRVLHDSMGWISVSDGAPASIEETIPSLKSNPYNRIRRTSI